MGSVEGPRSYNDTYERLVHDDTDLVGALAYALYKSDKRDYAKRHNLPYGDERLRSYASTVGSKQLESLRHRADEVMRRHLAAVASQAEDAVRKSTIGNIHASQQRLAGDLAEAKQSLTRHVSKRTGLGASVIANLIASFLFGVVMLILLAMQNAGLNPLDSLFKKAEAKDAATAPANSSPAPTKK